MCGETNIIYSKGYLGEKRPIRAGCTAVRSLRYIYGNFYLLVVENSFWGIVKLLLFTLFSSCSFCINIEPVFTEYKLKLTD